MQPESKVLAEVGAKCNLFQNQLMKSMDLSVLVPGFPAGCLYDIPSKRPPLVSTWLSCIPKIRPLKLFAFWWSFLIWSKNINPRWRAMMIINTRGISGGIKSEKSILTEGSGRWKVNWNLSWESSLPAYVPLLPGQSALVAVWLVWVQQKQERRSLSLH